MNCKQSERTDEHDVYISGCSGYIHTGFITIPQQTARANSFIPNGVSASE